MAEVDTAVKSLVQDELRTATDVGESRSRQQLQEAVGIGAGDLDAVLDELQGEGGATEQAPDEWVLSAEPAPEPPPAEEHDDEPGEEDESQEVGDEGGPEIPGRPRVPVEAGADVRVELPMAVAKALDSDDLGKIVEAGIAEAEERQASLVFVVES